MLLGGVVLMPAVTTPAIEAGFVLAPLSGALGHAKIGKSVVVKGN